MNISFKNTSDVIGAFKEHQKFQRFMDTKIEECWRKAYEADLVKTFGVHETFDSDPDTGDGYFTIEDEVVYCSNEYWCGDSSKREYFKFPAYLLTEDADIDRWIESEKERIYIEKVAREQKALAKEKAEAILRKENAEKKKLQDFLQYAKDHPEALKKAFGNTVNT